MTDQPHAHAQYPHAWQACPLDGATAAGRRAWAEAAWDDAAHLPPVARFFTSLQSTRLFAATRRPGDAGLALTAEAPKSFHRLVYFAKDASRFVTRDNIAGCVQFGVLHAAAAAGAPAAACADGTADTAAWPDDAGGGADVPGPQAALLQLLRGVYLPQLSAPSAGWPDSARREFLSTTHRFMAALTEAVHGATGRTVLYVPRGEGTAGELAPAEAARDRVLVQRLETTVIHWTRQVRAALHRAEALDALGGGGGGAGSAAGGRAGSTASAAAAAAAAAVVPGGGGGSGPLAEIAFWRQRALDLGGLNAQLVSREVCSVVAVLASAGSGYLADFEAQRVAIAREAAAGRDNVKYLACLEGPCAELAAAAPGQIPALLPRVLGCVRLVWTLSGHYNTPERLVGLLRRVAGEVVARCAAAARAHNPLAARGDGGVRAAVAVLADCIAACGALKAVYARTAAAVSRALPPERGWDGVDVTPVFPVVDAFLQRCRDLSDVCEAQLQFVPATPTSDQQQQQQQQGRRSSADAGEKGDQGAAHAAGAAIGRGLVLPVFGGARGAEMEKSIADIAAAFQGLMGGLRRLGYDVLDAQALQ
jgi:dynein heavy chain